jgi:S1-C subfamily serine protease
LVDTGLIEETTALVNRTGIETHSGWLVHTRSLLAIMKIPYVTKQVQDESTHVKGLSGVIQNGYRVHDTKKPYLPSRVRLSASSQQSSSGTEKNIKGFLEMCGTRLTAACIAASLMWVPSGALALTDPVVETQSSLSLEDQRIADIYDRVNPSVVNIFDATSAGQLSGRSQEGNGSGFIFDRQGHIVTNYHVLGKAIDSIGIEKAKSSKTPIARVLILSERDGLQKSFDGFLVGADKSRDLIVLKVQVNEEEFGNLKSARVGNSSDVRVGDTILSLGNPFGFEHSMSKGIVSAKNRGFQSYTDSTISGAFQIDAATNPGNSGGPVVDLDGEVVGVNTAIFTNTGVSNRIGFALPSNMVAKLVPQLIENGEIRRASLGIKPASDPIAQSLGITDGIVVQTVDARGPSAGKLTGIERGLAGVHAGDVIVKINDIDVRTIFDFNQQLDQQSIGDSVSVTYKRGGGSLQHVEITLAQEP